jgi:hypothetical protein
MRPAVSFLIGSALLLAGCGVAHDVAVGTYQVAAAPVKFVSRQFSDKPTEKSPSDVNNPGQPISSETAASMEKKSDGERSAKPTPSPSSRTAAARTPTDKPKASPTPAVEAAAASASFPTAKPVPDKPGYVFSPFDPSKYVDVTGYDHGSKVKDPYSGKIFLVP